MQRNVFDYAKCSILSHIMTTRNDDAHLTYSCNEYCESTSRCGSNLHSIYCVASNKTCTISRSTSATKRHTLSQHPHRLLRMSHVSLCITDCTAVATRNKRLQLATINCRNQKSCYCAYSDSGKSATNYTQTHIEQTFSIFFNPT